MIQFDETPDDLFPQGGYAELVRGIFARCKPELRLNEKVIEIDYSHNVVKVVTDKRVYYGKKVISSLPLGVLKHKFVKFVPELPQKYLDSIHLLDSSVH
jgi:monoamine oxidase